MGKSLQDQLLKAGLANKKQAVKARKAKNSKEKLKRTGNEVADGVEASAAAKAEEKRQLDRELNRQKNEIAEQKAVAAQVRQLIHLNDVRERGDIEFRFTDAKLIKSIYVTDRLQRDLANGQLAIVKNGESYAVVWRKVAEKIALRDEQCVLLLHDDIAGEEQQDDYYADFKVPDDLLW